MKDFSGPNITFQQPIKLFMLGGLKNRLQRKTT